MKLLNGRLIDRLVLYVVVDVRGKVTVWKTLFRRQHADIHRLLGVLVIIHHHYISWQARQIYRLSNQAD